MSSCRRFAERGLHFWYQSSKIFSRDPVCANVRAAQRHFRISSENYATMVKMPSLSPTMTCGTIVKWLKKEGDPVEPGDVLCEIQTDKAVVSFEIDDEGTLAKILMPENSTDVQVGTFIAVMAEAGEDWKKVEAPAQQATAKKTVDKGTPQPEKDTPTPTSSQAHKSEKIHLIGPAVRLMLDLYQVNAQDVSPTGPKGALLKSDVLKYVNAKKLTPKPSKASAPKSPAVLAAKPSAISKPSQPGAVFTDVPLTNMRRTIAKRLTQSKMSVPHAYLSANVDMSAVVEFRKRLKADSTVVSVNDFIIKACASALRQVPEVNVQFDGENARLMSSVDISVAVATESGLITPIVPNADQLGITAISAKVKELADKAKSNKLQLHEFQGGTFTVSNLGMFGISEFTAIINPPQASILAVGGSKSTLGEELKTWEKLTVTLCFDNRAIEEHSAARWLEAFKMAIEDPSFMLLGADAGIRRAL